MPLKRRFATFAAVTAALAVGPAGALAAAPGMTSTAKVPHGPTGVPFCLDPNPAWGCGPGIVGVGVLA